MLKIENVTKRYGKVVANDNISFQVGQGQIALLLGPNGAGKSTIIKCIVGLLRFSGRIEVDGKHNKSIEAKKVLGYVPEMPAIYDLLTIEEHMEFIRRVYRLPDDGYERVLLERFELWDKKNKLGKELSKGMQQKLSICCALLHRPKVIVFDEPMVGLDPHAIKELKQMLRELRAEGAAILISTHMLGSVDEDWDVAHIMVNGSFAATRYSHSQDESGEEKNLEELFFQITEGKGMEK
jgi:ABC-2 type transport system ATP-binding protein